MDIRKKDGSGFDPATARETAYILTAAHDTQGWLGGLDVPLQLLETYPNSFHAQMKVLKFGDAFAPLPLECFSISGHGLRQCRFEKWEKYSSQNAFGGDPRTQLIGYTICALSHEIQEHHATRMFLNEMLPYLVGDNTDILHALRICLLDDERIKKITNEGHARGMNDLFCEIADNMALPVLFFDRERDGRFPTSVVSECHLAGGLFKWLVSGSQEPYYTRSPLTARVAAYLQRLGYPITSVCYWQGMELPQHVGHRSVILYGNEDVHGRERDLWMLPAADTLALTHCELNVDAPILHYRFDTVGLMLHAAIEYDIGFLPRALQQSFVSIYS